MFSSLRTFFRTLLFEALPAIYPLVREIPLRTFLRILLFQAGPQDLPDSRFLLQLCWVLYFFAGLLVSLPNLSPLAALGASLLDTGLLSMLIWTSLRVRGYGHRIAQTLTAALGSLCLLTLLALLLDGWYFLLDETFDSGSGMLPTLIVIGLVLWSLAVLGHVLRQALSVALPAAAGLSLAYLALSYQLTSTFFGPLA